VEEGRVIVTFESRNGERFRLDGKRAIVTGGALGIGRAIAKTFATGGAIVHILDIDASKARETAAEITACDGKAHAHLCNVGDRESVNKAFQEVLAHGGLDILVNNAGIAHIGKLEDTSEADFDRILQVNVKGVYYCLHASIGHMKARGGVILNLASIVASAGVADRFAYSMSKGAVRAMTYSVAKDYLSCRIRCNCISPARVHTPFVDGYLQKNYPGREQEMYKVLAQSQPIGRMGDPGEVALLAQFLCSDDAAFITGSDYPIDGGFFNLRG
jgi:2-keto-3-deoxy-L-fuconate dehydrogenase